MGIIFFCATLIVSCREPDNDSGPIMSVVGSAPADTLSDHLQFFNAIKKTGAIPTASHKFLKDFFC